MGRIIPVSRPVTILSIERFRVPTFAGFLILAGCVATGPTHADEVPTSSSPTGDVPATVIGDEALERRRRLADFDTRFVDQLSLPSVAAPVAASAEIQSTAPLGRHTEEAINPPDGVNILSNLGLFPSLTVTVKQVDNPARIAGQDDKSDTSFSVVPEVRYRGAIRSRHLYELSASGSTESYDELTSLDNDSVQLAAALRLDMTDKLKTDIYAGRTKTSDPRGQTATRIIDDDIENDEYQEDSIGARVTIGRRTNAVQVVIGADQSQLDFTNNGQDQRDREDDRLMAGFYLNVSPRTSFFVTGTSKDFDYAAESSTQFNSVNNEWSVGVGWEPSYATSILLKTGKLEKNFDTSGFDDQDTESYLAKLTWAPTESDSLSLYTSRSFEESTDLGAPVIASRLIGLSIDHSFTDVFRGQVYVNFIDDELINVRDDEITDYGIGLYYDYARWLSVGAAWSHTDRSSTDPAAIYDSDSFSISVTFRPRSAKQFGDRSIQTSDDLRSSG